MQLILVSVSVGVVLGLLFQPEWLVKAVGLVQKYVIYVLIFLMGMGIGFIENLVSQAGTIGVGAVVFALCTALCSALCTIAFDKAFARRGEKR